MMFVAQDHRRGGIKVLREVSAAGPYMGTYFGPLSCHGEFGGVLKEGSEQVDNFEETEERRKTMESTLIYRLLMHCRRDLRLVIRISNALKKRVSALVWPYCM